jgi:hypothetical protein
MSKYADLQAVHRSALQHEQNCKSNLERVVGLIVSKYLGWPDKKADYAAIEPKDATHKKINDKFVIDPEGTVYASLTLPIDGAPTLAVDVSIAKNKEDGREGSWLITFGTTKIRFDGPGDGSGDADIAMKIGEIMADLIAQMNRKTWGGGA